MSLRWQIALALAAIAAVVGTAAGVGAYLTTAHELSQSIDDSLVTVAGRAAEQHGGRGGRDGGDGDGEGDALVCPDTTDLAPASDVKLIASDGSVTSCLASTDGSIDVPDDLEAGYRTATEGGHPYRVLLTSSSEGWVQVARGLDENDAVLARLRMRLAALVAAGIAVAVVCGWALARGIARPIVRLRDTAESIADTGDLATPIPAGGGGEVGSLSRSFTAMVAALGTSREQQRRLVDDASHEMRTPLTSLTSNLEYLEHVNEIPAEERREVLDAVQGDVAELTNLLTELVELATDRADDEAPELLVLGDVARDVAQRAARRSGRTIEVTVASTDGRPGLVEVRPHLLERAISNLLDNAVKYTPEGTPIEVEVSGGRIEVLDHGPGIDPEDQAFVFDRFYRATSARTEPGSGLGLSIVRQFADQHGGSVWARGRHDGPGAAVGFDLPPALNNGGM